MTIATADHDPARRAATRRYRSRAAVIVGVLAVVPLAVGCGGGGTSGGKGVASISSSASTPSSGAAAGSTKPNALAYSKCMRVNGIADFPDPQPDGSLQLSLTPGSDLDPNSAVYKAADAVCKPLFPAAQKVPADAKGADLKYAQCMRAHGIADFPDPQADGSLQIQNKPGSDLDPGNPQFKAANAACKTYLPGGGAGPILGSGANGS